MIRKREQVFIPPTNFGFLSELKNSPWHIDGEIYIPRESWELILEYSSTLNSSLAEKLEEFSCGVDDNYTVFASKLVLVELIDFLILVKNKILTEDYKKIEKLSSFKLDDYVVEEYVNMLDAVIAVFQESVKQEKPFRAWVE